MSDCLTDLENVWASTLVHLSNYFCHKTFSTNVKVADLRHSWRSLAVEATLSHSTLSAEVQPCLESPLSSCHSTIKERTDGCSHTRLQERNTHDALAAMWNQRTHCPEDRNIKDPCTQTLNSSHVLFVDESTLCVDSLKSWLPYVRKHKMMSQFWWEWSPALFCM